MRSKRLLALPFLGLAVSTAAAQAHDLWLTPMPGGIAVQFGHVHEPALPNADKLVRLSALTASGEAPLSARPDGTVLAALLPAGSGDALVSAAYDNGFWVRLREGGERNADRRAVPDAQRSQWSMKFAKAVTGPGAPWERVLGQTLEIVPLEAPGAEPGAIRVRVLFEGRPMAGAEIVAASGEAAEIRVTTDAEGAARVPLAQGGQQVLAVFHRVKPSRTPALADADAFSATLAFATAEPRTN
ncbi:DUF4198 domain-containing protein [Methylobacterium durans]|uniref:DUF4198 domain-containing protein n=1 Tax=Methylobacterium durans TaxID=2202825 RepID=UPI002AFEFCA8|nr:DUF4198 domain-containing protein [Methylobacterium durans]MEA1833133.1 DUF4198 domain-containing protein [Methylobacterium durans]